MSVLLRQLCVTLIVVVVIRCSQGYSIGYGTESDGALEDDSWEEQYGIEKRWPASHLRIGRSLSSHPELVTDGEDVITTDTDITVPYIKIGKRDAGYRRVGRGPANDKTFLRIGRQPSDSTFLRIGRTPFLRIGRAQSDSTFLRIGRDPADKTFLRIGRAGNNQKRFLRIGRAPLGQSFLRIGRSNEMLNDDGLIPEEDLTATQMLESSLGLTAEELQLLRENKDLLLAYIESNPDLFDGVSDDGDDDGYFAFPRQGRAMSFYFPRMGRSGGDDSNYCCAEGVRRVYTVGGGTLDICARGQTCCSGFSERTKLYKDLIIAECVAENGLDKIRDYMGDE